MAPPSSPAEALFRSAAGLQRAGRLAEAEQAWRAFLADAPDVRPAHHNLVAALRGQHKWTEARAALEAAARRWPDDPDIAYHLAVSRLAAGDYTGGWPLYEARRQVAVDRVEAPGLPTPEWRGEAVRSLLVWPEQGFGDQIQFARYLPQLRARGIAVTLVCRPPMMRLFEVFGLPMVASEGAVSLPPHDAWTLMGSLPLRFGTTLETIPPGEFLAPAPGGQGMGVVTRGRPSHPNDAHRSLPPAAAAALLEAPGAVSLHPADTGARDFAETAEIIRGLAVVVTVDTSVAHLAGAMGKPVRILLPAVGADWRWLHDRQDSPWYPSATLIRQARSGDWTEAVAAALAGLPG